MNARTLGHVLNVLTLIITCEEASAVMFRVSLLLLGFGVAIEVCTLAWADR